MTAIFPGTFDPVTLGHTDIIRRAALLFDRLIVAVLNNPAKSPLFSVQERVEMIRAAVPDPAVTVEAYGGLLAEFAENHGARYIVRSVRSQSDCAYELPMAHANRHLNSNLETVILFASAEYSYLSASLVREVASAGCASGFNDNAFDDWVPMVVKKALYKKFNTADTR